MILKTLSDIRVWHERQVIVLCHGCFDIFHYGHLMYLKKSKEMGDILVVSVTNDNFVNKGENRPISTIQQRIELINELKCVDYCCVSDDYSSVNIIKILQPNIYVKGMDVKGKETDPLENLFYENLELKKCGGTLVFVEYVSGLSSTNLIKDFILRTG